MNKKKRKQLVINAQMSFGKPYIIEASDEYGNTKYGIIYTPEDERLFINFASSHRDWIARDMKL